MSNEEELMRELQEAMSGIDIDAETNQMLVNIDNELRQGNHAEVNRLVLVSVFDEKGEFSEEPLDLSIEELSIKTDPEKGRITITQEASFQVSEDTLVDNRDELLQSRQSFVNSLIGEMGGDEEAAKDEVRSNLREFVRRLTKESRHDLGSQVSLMILLENPVDFDIENDILSSTSSDPTYALSRKTFVYHHPRMKGPKSIIETITFSYEVSDLRDPGVVTDIDTETMDTPDYLVTFKWVHTLEELSTEETDIPDNQIALKSIEGELVPVKGNVFETDSELLSEIIAVSEDNTKEVLSLVNYLRTCSDDLASTVEYVNKAIVLTEVESGMGGGPYTIFTWKDFDRVGINLISNEVIDTRNGFLEYELDSLEDFDIISFEDAQAVVNSVVFGSLKLPEKFEMTSNVNAMDGQVYRNYGLETKSSDGSKGFGKQSFMYGASSIVSDVNGQIIKDRMLARIAYSIDLTDYK